MRHVCKKSHAHETQKLADNCRICKRREHRHFKRGSGDRTARLLRRQKLAKAPYD